MKRPEPLPFNDIDRVAAWIEKVEGVVFDLVAVALDATAQPSRRVLTRKAARARVVAAQRTLAQLLDATRRQV